MVRAVPPVFFNVSVWDELLPTVTFPKLMLVGFVLRAPASTPVPESATFTVPMLVPKATLPLALPALVGAKRTLKFAPCPAARVKGTVMPLTL
jgi:hypothetical protein